MGGRLGFGEILLIVTVALLFFGPKKLPEIGKAIGSAVTEFKKGLSGLTGEREDRGHVPDHYITQNEHKAVPETVTEDSAAKKIESKPSSGPMC